MPIILTSNDFEQNGIKFVDGLNSGDSNEFRIRVKDFIIISGNRKNIIFDAKTYSGKSIQIGLFFYVGNTFLNSDYWYSLPYTYTNGNPNFSTIKISIKYSNEDEISPSDIEYFTIDDDYSWDYRNGTPLSKKTPDLPTDISYPEDVNWLWSFKRIQDSESGTIVTKPKNGYMPDFPTNLSFPERVKWAWHINPSMNEGNPYNGFMMVEQQIPEQKGYNYINLLDSVHVYSAPHGLNTRFPVLKISIPLNEPANTKYTLNSNNDISFTGSTSAANEELKAKVRELPKASVILTEAKKNATALIRSGGNGYVTLKREEMPDGTLGPIKEIIISDQIDYLEAKHVWRWNENGLGYSKDGYYGTFGTAITMGGEIVADFMTTGLMSADRIRGGELALGHWEYYTNNPENPEETVAYNGVLKVYRSDGQLAAKMDQSGAQIWGEVWSYDNGSGGDPTTGEVNDTSGRTTSLADGQVNFYLNGEKIGHVAGWSVYTGDTHGGSMSISAMDKNGNIGDGIIFQAGWIGVEGPDDRGQVTGIDMVERELKVVTDISYDSEGKISDVKTKTIRFKGPFMTTSF